MRKWVARFADRRRRQACRIARPGRIACTGRRRQPGRRAGRSPAPPALDRQADRSRSRRLAGDVSRILRRLGLNRIEALSRPTPVRRYEREHPGELIHIDIKKLGRFDRVGHRITGDRTGQSKRRGVGWEFVHVCIDDASRMAFSQILPDEKKESAVAFLKAAVAYYAASASRLPG